MERQLSRAEKVLEALGRLRFRLGTGGFPGFREGPLGLTIMRERTVHMGGKLHLESTPDKGTTVVAEFPVQMRAAS
ncbi:MAG: ATP-binding protein [Thermodesulfobacteriota bacterium]